MYGRHEFEFLEHRPIFNLQVNEPYDLDRGHNDSLIKVVEVLSKAFNSRTRFEHMLLHLVLRVNGVEECIRFCRYLIRDLSLDDVQIEAELYLSKKNNQKLTVFSLLFDIITNNTLSRINFLDSV